MQILMVEPGYRNKYPPLGLMKISTYHKLRGDAVTFVKGRDPEIRAEKWDRVYVATLFTFFWRETVETIRYYLRATASPRNVIVGGVMATLLGDQIEHELGVVVIRGLLDKPGMLDPGDRHVIDHLIPDYRILDDCNYDYGLDDAYVGYATRGCPNRCDFCAVQSIEPDFVHYLPLKMQVRGIEEVYGPRRDLLLLDNNVLASRDFERIIADILDLGFEAGATFRGRQRRVDFNQGIDARRLTREKMKLLSRTALKPLRLAFDYAGMRKRYLYCVKLARDHGLLKHSPYVLYNYRDTPQDFYERLRLNVILNEELGTKISSFPMKFIPLDAKDRSYIGPHWNRKLIRGVQCILLATRGMVSPRREFFEAAFGRSPEEFLQIALMPERYIIWRRKHEFNGADDWARLYRGLGRNQRREFLATVGADRVAKSDATRQSSPRLKRLLAHYVGPKED